MTRSWAREVALERRRPLRKVAARGRGDRKRIACRTMREVPLERRAVPRATVDNPEMEGKRTGPERTKVSVRDRDYTHQWMLEV
jgi:hypothetical protein